MGTAEIAVGIVGLLVAALAWGFRHGVVRRIDELERRVGALERSAAVAESDLRRHEVAVAAIPQNRVDDRHHIRNELNASVLTQGIDLDARIDDLAKRVADLEKKP